MKSPEECACLADVRSSIDELDHEIVSIIARRARYVDVAARFKGSAKGVRAPERQSEMLAERRRWAEDEDLDPAAIEVLFQDLVQYFIAREMLRWSAERTENDT